MNAMRHLRKPRFLGLLIAGLICAAPVSGQGVFYQWQDVAPPSDVPPPPPPPPVPNINQQAEYATLINALGAPNQCMLNLGINNCDYGKSEILERLNRLRQDPAYAATFQKYDYGPVVLGDPAEHYGVLLYPKVDRNNLPPGMTYEQARAEAFKQGMVVEMTNVYSYIAGDYRQRSWDDWESLAGKPGVIETGLKEDPLGYLYNYSEWYWADPPVYPTGQLHQPEGPKEPVIKKVKSGKIKDVEGRQSVDPNDKIGPVGVGTARYISGLEPLRYVIRFENLAAAGAPAQTVDIEECLDGARMDLGTFSLAGIGSGAWILNVPPGKQRYDAIIDLRPARDLLVEVAAALDQANNKVRWHFRSLDPATGGLPAFDGFLPPNVLPPEGQGSVGYSVALKSTVPTGTEVGRDCRASIVFDGMTAQALQTNDWINTVDRHGPTSSMTVNSTSPTRTFDVRWSGTDAGASGVRDYTIYASASNTQPFPVWREKVTETSGKFIGVPGQTYWFYSIARDQVFNVGAAPGAVASVTVADQDRDGRADGEDNCPTVANPDQADANGNGIGDACEAPAPIRGDLDRDGDVDQNDLNLLLAARNQPATGPNDPRDLDGDGKITVLDARKLTLLCTRPRCATQ